MTRLPFWRREVSESKSKSVSFSSAKKKNPKLRLNRLGGGASWLREKSWCMAETVEILWY